MTSFNGYLVQMFSIVNRQFFNRHNPHRSLNSHQVIPARRDRSSISYPSFPGRFDSFRRAIRRPARRRLRQISHARHLVNTPPKALKIIFPHASKHPHFAVTRNAARLKMPFPLNEFPAHLSGNNCTTTVSQFLDFRFQISDCRFDG